MKNRNFKIGALLVSLFAASCSPALYQSGAYNIDDMYAEHDVTRIAQEKQAIARSSQGRSGSPSRRNRGPAGGSRILRIGRLLPGRAGRHVRKRLCPSFAGIQLPDLSDADELFQPSLQRHLPIRFGLRPGRLQHHRHGRRSVGRTQIHYFDVRHMGFSQHSELRMERRSLQRLVFQLGLQSLSLGIPGFGWPYYSYNPYWGYPYWGGYYPYWGYYPGWGGGHHHHPYPPHHRPNVVHRSTYRYGSGAGSNIGSTSFGGRGQGGMTNGYRNGTTIGSGSFRGGRTNSNSSSSFRGGSSSVNRGSSTYRNPSFGGNSSSYRGSSSTPNRGTYTPAPSQPNRGSSGSFVGGGGGVRGGNSSGRNSYGR